MNLEQEKKGEGWVEEDFSRVGLKAESAEKQILPSLRNPRNSHRSGGPTPQAPIPGQEHSRLSTHRCLGGSSSSGLWTRCHRFLSVAISSTDITEAAATTLWVKAQHEGALPPPCIVRKDPRVPHTARRGA